MEGGKTRIRHLNLTYRCFIGQLYRFRTKYELEYQYFRIMELILIIEILWLNKTHITIWKKRYLKIRIRRNPQEEKYIFKIANKLFYKMIFFIFPPYIRNIISIYKIRKKKIKKPLNFNCLFFQVNINEI